MMKNLQNCFRFHQKGFTLIELMVVVVIIAIFSGLLIPKLLSVYDKARSNEGEMRALEQPVQEQQQRQGFMPPQGVPPVIESVEMQMELISSYHRVGMRVYTRYEVHCQGSFLFRRSAQDANPVLLTIPFPEGRTEARDVRLTLTRLSDSTTWEPDNLVYHGQRLYWNGDIPENEQLLAEVNFVALGREQFEYRLPPARQLRSLKLVLDLKEGVLPKIPDHALQPTEVSGQELVWQFNNLITDRAIILEIPGALSPLGRVLLLVRLVAIAVLLFGIGFWYLSEQWQPGLLKDFRWGHFLLLALTYSLYFVIFAVISFHENVNTWLAMGISALFSLPLLLLHLTRVINFQFAYRRALPLAVFTLALVINGVYGGSLRDYIFIAAVIFVIAYLTISYDRWATARSTYRDQQRAEHRKRVQAIRNTLTGDVKQLIDDTKAADKEAGRLLKSSQHDELTAETYTLIQKRRPVTELSKRYRELSKRLPELSLTSYEFDYEWYDSFEQEIEQFEEETRQTLGPLQNAIEALKSKKELLKARQGEDAVYCVACGSASPPSPYCRECGMRRYKELTCRECGERILLPLHAVSEAIESLTLHCPHCGDQYEAVILKTSQPSKTPQDDQNTEESKKARA